MQRAGDTKSPKAGNGRGGCDTRGARQYAVHVHDATARPAASARLASYPYSPLLSSSAIMHLSKLNAHFPAAACHLRIFRAARSGKSEAPNALPFKLKRCVFRPLLVRVNPVSTALQVLMGSHPLVLIYRRPLAGSPSLRGEYTIVTGPCVGAGRDHLV